MSTYTTLAAMLAGLACAASSSLATEANTERLATSAKTPAAASGAASTQRALPRSRPAAPVRWDGLDPRTIERAEKRRSVEVPSFPPERQ
jgi:hypothetical protein